MKTAFRNTLEWGSAPAACLSADIQKWKQQMETAKMETAFRNT